MAKKLLQKPMMVVGSGFFDKLRSAANTALKMGAAVGIKPSDIISGLTKNKSGLTGTLGTLGASLAKQQGYGMMKKGMKVHEPGCKMCGKGFFGDVWKGFKSVVAPIASIAAPIISAAAPQLAPAIAVGSSLLGNGMCGKGPSSMRMRGGCGVAYSNSSSLRVDPSTLRL
jgi:hypothetical protein